jgi:hypothetical protein
MIGNLRRKPGALRNLVYREALFPDHAYRRAWQAFDAQLDGRQACRDAVALLDIAARGDCVDVLARRMDLLQTLTRFPRLGSCTVKVSCDERFQRTAFTGEVILWAVRWYCRYGISYRDLEEMLSSVAMSIIRRSIAGAALRAGDGEVSAGSGGAALIRAGVWMRPT